MWELCESELNHVAVLGDVFVDIILRVPSYPPEGFDAMATRLSFRQGGSSTATACALSKLGCASRVIGRIGCDGFGDIVVKKLRECGIVVDKLQRDPDRPTGLTFVVVTDSGERTMFAYRGANDYLEVPTVAEHCRWLHLSGYALLSSYQRRAVEETFSRAVEAGIGVSIDIGVEPARSAADAIRILVPRADVVFPSRREAPLIYPGLNPFEAAHRMVSAGAGCVALKLGSDGSYVVTDRGGLYAKIPPFQVSIHDTTGAGDAFNAGFITGWLQGLSPVQCCILGNAVAAVVIERGEGVEGMPSGAEGIAAIVSLLNVASHSSDWSTLQQDLSVVRNFVETRITVERLPKEVSNRPDPSQCASTTLSCRQPNPISGGPTGS